MVIYNVKIFLSMSGVVCHLTIIGYVLDTPLCCIIYHTKVLGEMSNPCVVGILVSVSNRHMKPLGACI